MTDRFPRLLAAAGLLAGMAAALAYYRHGLTLSHYDAKAHLVVARRILDSLTPEYSQIGAVWLPLPHLLNLLPVQIDVFYRTGASAVIVSILSFALACYAMGHLVLRMTQSRAAAAVSVGMFALDPNVLYLQSTPMTEALLFGLTLYALCAMWDWADAASDATGRRRDLHRLRTRSGVLLILACLTRYEAWIVTAAALALAAVALWRSGLAPIDAAKETAHVAIYPAVAVVGFFFHSWFTTGAWFVTGGFFVPENVAHDDARASILAVVYGMRLLVGTPVLAVAAAGAVFAAARGLSRREWATSLVPLALTGFMVLPAYAFFQGHPFRMRYLIAPSVGAIVFAGVAIGSLAGRWRRVAALAAIAWLAATAKPMDAKAPMVLEAQWDVPNSAGRRDVTACLMRDYHGELILASMGSLAHYMQELSLEGLNIRNFVHEGNLPYWQESIEAPKGRVGWILVEERAEGGDLIAAQIRESSAFLTGFTRVCDGGGVALYKADRMPQQRGVRP